MENAVLVSPSSDEKLWMKLRNRVDAILEDRKPDPHQIVTGGESERGKRLREDSLLLLKGLDSVSSSLSNLSETLTAAQQGVSALAKSTQNAEKEIEEEPVAKRQRASSTEKDEKQHQEEEKDETADGIKSAHLKKARNLAVTMASKAGGLARELKSVKSELEFMKERCSFLEEENTRLREDHYSNGLSSDQDDMLRLQVEALMAEKSRLAQENANLVRENQSLVQLVEYHQLTSMDLSASYDQFIEGVCLDFESPVEKGNGESSEEGEE
ncbi:hypothetical protein LUZ60_016183 [Juncus effusus]|nr:hypothetical protein LUZ60_016183 [Juncus effusus]